MNIITVCGLCFAFFVFGVNVAGASFLPDKYPFNVYENLGWLFYCVILVLWDIGRST